jgi:preprotein translocase SecE subunit
MYLTKYFKESLEEFNHVSWPTRKQTIRLTILVIGFVILSSIFIGIFDFIFTYLVAYSN